MNPQDAACRLSVELTEDAVGKRLDAALTKALQQIVESDSAAAEWNKRNKVTRSKVACWIQDGLVCVAGKELRKPSLKLKSSCTVVCELPDEELMELDADASVPFEVVHEDDSVLVVNKPAGVVVHPGAGHRQATLVHGLLAHLGAEHIAVGNPIRPGIVHRLDKDTSGLLVVAKSDRSLQHLVEQFGERSIKRHYLALVYKRPSGGGIIDLPIGRHPTRRQEMAVEHEHGRAAVTEWQVESELPRGLLLKLKLQTGRTHQIRVHLRAMGAPIVGDQTYGSLSSSLSKEIRDRVLSFGRQALHAIELEFIHPATGKVVQFRAEPPDDMLQLIESFGK